MKKVRNYFIVLLITTSWSLPAQDVDSLVLDASDSSLFSLGDTLSVFALIDSLLALDASKPTSQLALRLSYNSNVIAAGRTLGIENFGLSPGASYYHKSGAYADASGFWSRDFVPKYYLTIATIGYSHIFTKYFSLLTGYDRYFYNVDDDAFIPYRNSISVTPMIDIKPVNLNISYSYFFGDKKVHRILPSLGATIQKKKWRGINRIAFLPSFSVLFGNETFTETEYRPPQSIREALDNIKKYGMRFSIVEVTRNEFGIMNYSINLPLSVTYKKWNFIFSYSYNIPKALPGEYLTLSESNFLSASLTYIFELRRDKMPWE